MDTKFKVGDEVTVKGKITDIDPVSDLQISVRVEVDTGYGKRGVWLDDRGVRTLGEAPELSAIEYLRARQQICSEHNKVHHVCNDQCILTKRESNVVNTCRALERMYPEEVVARVQRWIDSRDTRAKETTVRVKDTISWGVCRVCGFEYLPAHPSGYCAYCRPYEITKGENISGIVKRRVR